MVKLEGRCVIYSKIDKNNFYTAIYELCGGIASILNSAIVYIRNLNDDPRFDNFYVVIVNLDDHLDQNIKDLDFILSLDPVLSIHKDKKIGDYQKELDELVILSGIDTITPEIKNTIIDYKNIIQNYNSGCVSTRTYSIDDIIDCIKKFINVIKNYNGNEYRILDYIDKKYYDGISNDITNMIYDKLGMTLMDFSSLVKEYDLCMDIIQKLLLDIKIDGTIEMKKQLTKSIVKRYDTNKRNI